jgi:hypothetical protein
MLVRQSNQISSKTQDNKMVVPQARRQLGGMGYLNLLRCFKIVPILGLVVYTISWTFIIFRGSFNIRGVQEVLSIGANVPTENIEVLTAALLLDIPTDALTPPPLPLPTTAKPNTFAKGYASSGSDAAVKNAVVHIGPHKTGSTTIQEQSRALQTHLLSDGYGMPYAHTFTDGKQICEPWCNQVNVATCFIHNANHSSKRNFPCRNDLLQAGLDIGHRMNNSILLSAETFSYLDEEGVAALHDYLHPTWENITIVAYYRRYYDWILSCHSEISRLSFAQAWHKFQQNSTDRLHESLLNILTNTELPYPKQFLEVHRHVYVLSVIPRYKKYFSNVVVVNMHDQSMDLSERFYCELVPHASKTCEAWRHMSSTGNLVKESNKHQQNVEYIELAYAAHRKGMIHVKTEQHCRDVVDAIQVYHETTNKLKISDFPRQCLQAAALNNVWEVSVQAEKEFGSTVSLGNDGQDPLDVLKDDFDKKSKSQLCEVDFDVILETAVWREFFTVSSSSSEGFHE